MEPQTLRKRNIFYLLSYLLPSQGDRDILQSVKSDAAPRKASRPNLVLVLDLHLQFSMGAGKEINDHETTPRAHARPLGWLQSQVSASQAAAPR